jgi:hypothetical protein
MGEWLLSRRDRLTVARHEVPVCVQRHVPILLVLVVVLRPRPFFRVVRAKLPPLAFTIHPPSMLANRLDPRSRTEPSHITAYIYVVVNAIRTPFQGDFLVRVVPRAQALGCFLFARRALGTRTRKCPKLQSRHFVPGYYRAVPSDKSHSPIEAPHNQGSLPVGPCWMDIRTRTRVSA